jgi:hypothetical protein
MTTTRYGTEAARPPAGPPRTDGGVGGWHAIGPPASPWAMGPAAARKGLRLSCVQALVVDVGVCRDVGGGRAVVAVSGPGAAGGLRARRRGMVA